jgi:transposase
VKKFKGITLSSKLSTKYANIGKCKRLQAFIADYRLAVGFYVSHIWHTNKIDQQHFQLPKYLITTGIDFTSDLSARAKCCAMTQAIGMIKSRVKKLSKIQYVIKKHQKQSKNTAKLQSKYDKLLTKLKMPKTENVFPELASICCSFKIKKTKLFDGFVVLSSLGKKYGKISIPIKSTKHRNYLNSICKQLTSFLITDNDVQFRYQIAVETKTIGSIEGADQGVSTCVTLSDAQTTPSCVHGYNLSSICKKISKKERGSKAFSRAQAHRTNYINWSIKQLNLDNIRQINIEKLKYLGKGKRTSKFLRAFSYPTIMTAMKKNCYLAGVLVQQQSNAYRSQRCNHCGFVHKSNRHGKLFTCIRCKFTCDADLNAAMNHRDLLYDLPIRSYHLPNKSTGFYWLSDGIFKADGLERIVPIAEKSNVVRNL